MFDVVLLHNIMDTLPSCCTRMVVLHVSFFLSSEGEVKS